MKKYLSICLSMLMLLNTVSIPVFAASDSAEILINDSFDSGEAESGAWSSLTFVDLPDGTGGKCVVFSDSTTNTLTLPETVNSGVLVIDYDMYTPSVADGTKSYILYADTTKTNLIAVLPGGTAVRNSNWSNLPDTNVADLWHNYRIVIDFETGKYYFQLDGNNMSAMINDAFISKFTTEGVSSFKFISGTTMYVDNVKVSVGSGLNTFNSKPSDGATGVATDSEIKLNFNIVMNTATLSDDNISLVNKKTGDTVPAVVTDIKNASVSVVPNEPLEYYTEYEILLSDAVTTEAGETLADNSISFKTAQIEINDTISVVSSSYENNQSTVILSNSEGTDKTVSVITALYENNGTVPDTMIDYHIEEKTVSAGGEETFVSKAFTTEKGKEYTSKVFIWDSLDGKNVLAPSVTFGTEKDDTVSEGEASSAISFIKKSVDVNTGVVDIDAASDGGGNLRAAYTVENPDGDLCWIGQSVTQGDNGAFGIDFKFDAGTVNGTYTIKARTTNDANITTDTFEVDTSSSIPSASAVKIDGEPVVGKEVTGAYDFFHIGNAQEKESTYKWYVADSVNGEFFGINGETDKKLKLTADYSGKYIKFEVTPKTANATGEAVLSDAVAVLSPPIARNVRIEGTVRAGESVSAAYSYYHISGEPEGETEIRWFYSDNGDDWEEVGTKSTLNLRDSYAGGYIKVEITPVSETYPNTGAAVESDSKKVSKKQSQSASVGSGGGGSSVVKGDTSVTIPQQGTTGTTDNTQQSTSSNAMFTDIAGHWSQAAVEELASAGIVNGYDDGSFMPSANISRAEFVTLIVNALDIDEGENKIDFEDVNESNWFYDAVRTASSNGIVSGDGTVFRPNDNITREEIAVVIINAYNRKYGDDAKGSDNDFADSDKISEWALESVNAAVELGIIAGDDNSNFRPSDLATRAESATVIHRFINLSEGEISESGSVSKVEILSALGLMGPTDNASVATVGDMASVMDKLSVYYDASGRESEPLIWDEALKQCLLALNYAAILDYSGDSYETLVQLAASEDMLDDVSCVKGGAVSVNDFSVLIYNTLHCLPVSGHYDGTAVTLDKADQTLLSEKLNITVHEGIVTGVPVSRLYSSEGIKHGYIEVSNALYKYDGVDINNLLGSPVCIYLESESDEVILLENLIDEYESMTINWSNIEDVSGSTITYEVSSRSKKETLNKEAVVLKNNMFMGFMDSVSEDVLKPERGEIKLIDNDDDGEFDVVSVTSYDIFVVDSTNVQNAMILLKNEAGYIKLEDDTIAEEIHYTMIRNGEAYPISELKEWDVLIVKSAENKSGDMFYDIQIVRRTVTGTVTGYGDEYINLDGVEYVKAPSLDTSEIKIGNSYTFAFAGNDEIAAVCTEAGIRYGYLVKAYYVDGEEQGFVKLCTSGNEKLNIELADKVKYNTGSKSPSEICDEFTTHQVITYNVNDEGKISEIYKAVDNSASGDNIDEFSLDASKANRRYYKEQFGAFYQMDSSGVAFFVADVTEGEEFTVEHVKVGDTSAYQSSNGVDCEFYDVDELGNAKAAIFYDFANGDIPAKTVPVIVVADIRQEVDDEGNEGSKIYFYENGEYKSLFMADDVKKAEAVEFPYEHHSKIDDALDLNPGDVVEYATDIEGKFAVYRPVFLVSQNNTMGAYSQTESGIQPLYDAAYNQVDYAKDGNFVMNYGADKRRYSTISSTSILKYDSDTEELTVATKDDILGKNSVGEDASKVFALRYWTQLKLVVIYE